MALAPTSSHGGGSAPTTREEWSGNAVSIADADFAWLPWNSTTGPDAVLDTTVPAHPTIITAGVYLVSVVVTGNVLATGWFDAELHLDRTGFDASMSVTATPNAVAVGTVPLCFAWYIPAGGQVAVGADNHDGAAARNFSISYAHLQRLS